MRAQLLLLAAMVLGLLGAACGKDSAAATKRGENVVAAPQDGNCSHSACGTNYFIDSASSSCAVGAICSTTMTLVATGDYHVNDEYPYKFRATDAQGVEFLGTDAGGKSVFSKSAGDWQKVDAKSGTMTVKFRAADKGSKAIAGAFKLSVCSAANCQLEGPQLSTTVAVQ